GFVVLSVGAGMRENKWGESEFRKALLLGLAQTKIHPACISEAVPILGENHYFFDVGELFERCINLRLHTPICTDPTRVGGTTEFQCGRTCFRNCPLLVQFQCFLTIASVRLPGSS